MQAAYDGREFVKTLPGATAPFGFFDPLGLTPEARDDVLLWREAELNHGRVAMMAALGFFVQETGFHPIFPDAGGPAAFQLDVIDSSPTGAEEVVLALLIPIFMTETFRAKKGWVEPDFASEASSKTTVRTLREGYMPGDLGFDPLNLKPTGPTELLAMQNKELNNGRLAMIAVAGMVGQELATGLGLNGEMPL
uniref:Light harvesting protein n=1 Tax=Prymnesium polylepis TaxID=72548 RepID=A0A7S4I563_9EUKA